MIGRAGRDPPGRPPAGGLALVSSPMWERGLSGAAAIAGLGITALGKVYGRTSAEFAPDAVLRAVADAGLRISDVDGLLTSNGITGGGSFMLADTLGLRDLRLNVTLSAAGATASAAIQYGAMAVASGMCDAVVYVHA